MFGYQDAKPVQLETLLAILRVENVFVSVPTGYGKSFVYQVLPACATYLLEGLQVTPPSIPRVLVVSPLILAISYTKHFLMHVCRAIFLWVPATQQSEDQFRQVYAAQAVGPQMRK